MAPVELVRFVAHASRMRNGIPMRPLASTVMDYKFVCKSCGKLVETKINWVPSSVNTTMTIAEAEGLHATDLDVSPWCDICHGVLYSN